MKSKDPKLQQRVKEELMNVGLKYAMHSMEARHLHEVIHEDEHIMAAAFGVSNDYSALLVATDRRIIYLDKKPLFSVCDEISYDMVSGVGHNVQRPFAALTLHTRLGDYTLRFVRIKTAENFVKYIETRRLEHLENGNLAPRKPAPAKDTPAKPIAEPPAKSPLSKEGAKFLHQHHTATLSTVDRTGNVNGAVIFYFVDANNTIYILTKSETRKAYNIVANRQVAITIYDAPKLQTLQLQGIAEIEADPGVKSFVLHEMTLPSRYDNGLEAPPVTKLQDGGEYMVIRVLPTHSRYHDFGS